MRARHAGVGETFVCVCPVLSVVSQSGRERWSGVVEWCLGEVGTVQ